MPVNWGQQQFRPKTQLNLAPAIQTYFNARKNKREQQLQDLTLEKAEIAKKRKLKLQGLQQQAQGDRKVYSQLLRQSGEFDLANKNDSEILAEQKKQAEYDKIQGDIQKQNNEQLDKWSDIYSKIGMGQEPQVGPTQTMEQVTDPNAPDRSNAMMNELQMGGDIGRMGAGIESPLRTAPSIEDPNAPVDTSQAIQTMEQQSVNPYKAQEEWYNRNVKPKTGRDWSPQMHQSIMARSNRGVTRKELIAQQQEFRNKELNDSFRKFVPSIDIAKLETDKNYRNVLAQQILSRPDGNSELAQATLKSLKSPGNSFAETMAEALAKQNLKGENRPVPASQAVEIGGTADAVQSLDTIMSVIPALGGTDKWTPITDPISGLNPWNTRAQAKKQYIATIKQVIGKGLEGGVMRAEDERKYDKIIPKMGDTMDVFQSKGKQLRQAIINKRKFMLQGLGSAGFNVSNFKDLETSEPTFKFSDKTKENRYKKWLAEKEAERALEAK